MTAHSTQFPWSSYYGNFDFFESRMRAHQRVQGLSRTEEDGVYLLRLVDGRQLRVFVCECYSFGVAEYHEVLDNIGKVDAVVISSAWCGYTRQAKEYTREQHVGLFKVGEFMGALNKPKIWEYMSQEEKERQSRKSG
jgi:hypothetical protein